MKNRPLITDLRKALGSKVGFYRGHWVAIRFDEVIAYSNTLASLLQNIGDIEVVIVFIPKEEDHYGI